MSRKNSIASISRDSNKKDDDIANDSLNQNQDIAAAGAMMMRRVEQAVDIGAHLNITYDFLSSSTSGYSGNSSQVASASVFCGHDLQLDAFPDISHYKAHSSSARISHLQLCCNSLRSLQGVTLFHNLWSLDLSANRLVSLRGLECFSVLGQLWLGRNFLDYEALAPLTARLGMPGGLEILDLRLDGNMALTQFEGYRTFILFLLPRVWMLDGRFVTAAERKSSPDDIQRYRRKPAFVGKSDPTSKNMSSSSSSSSSSTTTTFFAYSKPFSKLSSSNSFGSSANSGTRGQNENSTSAHTSGLTAPQTVGSLRSVWADRFLNCMPVDFIMQKELDYARIRILARNLENDAEVLGIFGLIATAGLPAGFAQILIDELSMELQSLWSVLMAAFFILPRERWWIQDLAQHIYVQLKMDKDDCSSMMSSSTDNHKGSPTLGHKNNHENNGSNHDWITREIFKAPMPLFIALFQLLVARLTIESDSASSNILHTDLLVELQNLVHYLALFPITEPPHIYERRHPAEDLHQSLPPMPLLMMELVQMATLLPTPPTEAVGQLFQQAEKIRIQAERNKSSLNANSSNLSNEVTVTNNQSHSQRSTTKITISSPSCLSSPLSANGSSQTRISNTKGSKKRPLSATNSSQVQTIGSITSNSLQTKPSPYSQQQLPQESQSQSKNIIQRQREPQKLNTGSKTIHDVASSTFSGIDVQVPVHYSRSTEHENNGHIAKQISQDKSVATKTASLSPAPSVSPASPIRSTSNANQDRINERQRFESASASEMLEWRYLVCKEAQKSMQRWLSLKEKQEAL